MCFMLLNIDGLRPDILPPLGHPIILTNNCAHKCDLSSELTWCSPDQVHCFLVLTALVTHSVGISLAGVVI